MASGTDSANSSVTARTRQRRTVVQVGFALLTALLLISMGIALEVQRSLSDNTEQIYKAHVLKDELLHRLRRTLWFGATATRDFLLNPKDSRVETFVTQLAPLRAEQLKLIDELDSAAANREATSSLRAAVDGYWTVLERVPSITSSMTSLQRFEYVEREIAPRRNAASDVVREFAAMDRIALDEARLAFAATRNASTQRLLFLLGLAAVCGAAVSVLSLLHTGRLERAAALHLTEVEGAKRELERLSARLMDVQEEERAKLARELHDEIGQTLAALRLEITRPNGNGVNGSSRESVDRARMLVDRTMQSIRDLSLLLRPSILDDLGLAPALQWQAEGFAARTGVQVMFEESQVTDDLPDAVRTCVYRVLQESLHNCEKHADARTVHIRLEQSGEQVSMTVRDDGRGFDVSGRRPTGLGLAGMRERAQALNGVLLIDSSPGNGATITLRVPTAVPSITQ